MDVRTGAAIACLLALSAARADAAQPAPCPIEHAVYADRDGLAELAFQPSLRSATVTNSFVLTVAASLHLDGIVMWTQGEARSFGSLRYECPEGDVTGEEIAACTLWEGVVYAVDGSDGIGLLPAEGTDAPIALLLPDLGPSLRASAAVATAGLSRMPWDAFRLTGCRT